MEFGQELTLLSEEELFGYNSLEVIKKYGRKCAVTDLAILTGAYVNKEYTIEEYSSLTGRTSWYWTRSDDGNNNVRAIHTDGHMYYGCRYEFNGAVRPALSSSVIFSKISTNIVRGYNGTEEVAYGEYPQMAADERMQDILEREYPSGLIKTGRSYTFDSRKKYDYDKGFSAITYEEYEYEGKKYIRVKANIYLYANTSTLSNGISYKNGDYVWVEVSPVIWLIDKPTGMLISKKGLVSGIRYLSKEKKYKGDFDSTEMKEYLDKYMTKDLFQSIYLTKEEDEVDKLLKRINTITNSLEENTKNTINSKIKELITKYKQDLESSKPKFNLENDLNLSMESTPTDLKNKLITTLEVIITQLSSQETLVNFLNEINNFQSLLDSQIEVPSHTENLTDKILYIISIGQKYDKSILNSLKITLDSMDILVSRKLSNIITGEIELTTNYEKDVRTILNEKINHLYENVEKYMIISSILNGTYDSNLSRKIKNIRATIISLYKDDKPQYKSELEKIEKNITFELCETKTIKEIEEIIADKIALLEKDLMLISSKSIAKKELLDNLAVSKDNKKSAISSMIYDIYGLMEENQIDTETKEEVKEKIDKVLEKWNTKVIQDEVTIDYSKYKDIKLTDTSRIELDILSELSNIKINLELYINKKEEYDKVNKSI